MALIVPSYANASNVDERNLASVRREVLAYIQQANTNDAELLRQADDSLNSAIDRLNTTHWTWLRPIIDIAMIDGQFDYDELPADFRRQHSVMRVDSNGKLDGRLRYLDNDAMDRKYPQTRSTSQPTRYTVYRTGPRSSSGILSLNYAPGAGHVGTHPYLRFRYYARIPKLEGAIDGLQAPSEVWDFMKWYARFEITSIRGDSEASNVAERQWRDMFNELLADNSIEYTDIS